MTARKNRIKPSGNTMTKAQFMKLYSTYTAGRFHDPETGRHMRRAQSSAGVAYEGRSWWVIHRKIQGDYALAGVK